MYPSASATHARQGVWSWPARAEAWLDARGRKAWVVAIVLSFVLFWPAGLALLAYALWSSKMSGTCAAKRHNGQRGRDWSRRDWSRPVYQTSGNTAFDSYKETALKRLEEEQEAFASFLQRLRDAKDKQEFDSFMDDRARRDATRPSDQRADQPGDQPGDAATGKDTPRNGDY